MANYIKIKAADVNVANQTSDVLIGGIVGVFQGIANGTGAANTFVILLEGGVSMLLTTTAKGAEWANQVSSAVTANPGGVMSIVQNTTGVKVTDIVVA